MPSIKGTASVADSRALSKALKSTKFPDNFSKKINLSKINRIVLTQWIEQKITQVLGFEDEIVQSTAVNLFLPTPLDDGPPVEVDPRKAQVDIAGFLGDEEAQKFAAELWDLMLDAQEQPVGIPRKMLEEKKKELAQHQQQRQQQQQEQQANVVVPNYPHHQNWRGGRGRDNRGSAPPVSPPHGDDRKPTPVEREERRYDRGDRGRGDRSRYDRRDDRRRDDSGGRYWERYDRDDDDRRRRHSRSDRDRREGDYRPRRRDYGDDRRSWRDDRDYAERRNSDRSDRSDRRRDRSRSRSRDRRDRHRRRRDSRSSSSSQRESS